MSRTAIWFTTSALLFICSLPLSGARAANLVVGSEPLRYQAVFAPLPDYPIYALKAGEDGRVVISLAVSVNGRVESVQILESSAPSFGVSVQSVVRKWIFDPFKSEDGTTSYRATGRLVFYFRVNNRTPIIIDAAAQSLKSRGFKIR